MPGFETLYGPVLAPPFLSKCGVDPPSEFVHRTVRILADVSRGALLRVFGGAPCPRSVQIERGAHPVSAVTAGAANPSEQYACTSPATCSRDRLGRTVPGAPSNAKANDARGRWRSGTGT